MFLVTVDQEATGREIVIVTIEDQADDQEVAAGAAGMTTGVQEEAVVVEVVAADDVIEKSSRLLGTLVLVGRLVLLLFNHFHKLANISLSSYIFITSFKVCLLIYAYHLLRFEIIH